MGEYHVHRTYDDFEWLQQHLFSQEEVPGIQGVIVSTSFQPRSVWRVREDQCWVKETNKICVFCPSFLPSPRRLRWTHLLRSWNSSVGMASPRCLACLLQPDPTCPFARVPAGFLALGDWRLYCRALETFLRQIATHTVLGKNKAVEIFLTNSGVSGQKTNNPFTWD